MNIQEIRRDIADLRKILDRLEANLGIRDGHYRPLEKGEYIMEGDECQDLVVWCATECVGQIYDPVYTHLSHRRFVPSD